MDEQGQVNGWIPREGVPRHGPPEHLQLGMWHDPREHLVERVSRDRGLPVAGEEASPLMAGAASGGPSSTRRSSARWRRRGIPTSTVPSATGCPLRDCYSAD